MYSANCIENKDQSISIKIDRYLAIFFGLKDQSIVELSIDKNGFLIVKPPVDQERREEIIKLTKELMDRYSTDLEMMDD